MVSKKEKFLFLLFPYPRFLLSIGNNASAIKLETLY